MYYDEFNNKNIVLANIFCCDREYQKWWSHVNASDLCRFPERLFFSNMNFFMRYHEKCIHFSECLSYPHIF